MTTNWGHEVIKLNEDDLRIVFDNRGPHLTFSNRMNRDELAARFTKENNPEKPYKIERIDAVQRHWDRVPKGFLDKVRTQQEEDKTHKARAELLCDLALYISEQDKARKEDKSLSEEQQLPEHYSANQILEWVVSSSEWKPLQIMAIRDHRPSHYRTEGKPRKKQLELIDLFTKLPDHLPTNLFANLPVNLFGTSEWEIQQVVTRSRRLCKELGSFELAELPDKYLRTTVASWSENTLRDMLGDPILHTLEEDDRDKLLARAAGVTYAGLDQFLGDL